MNPEILKKAESWTSSEYDTKTREEIQHLINTKNEVELTDRFWQDLEFGTGGLRGIRGAGTNRMNIYNIRKATQGLADYIKAKGGAEKGVVIGRDSRLYSLEFAQEAASVLIANGIRVYFFEDICATPITSYTIIKLGAQAGIMNTASHNPKDYNGYKVFWENGGQLVPPDDNNVIAEIRKIHSLSEIKTIPFAQAEESELFRYCNEYQEKYLQEATSCSRNPDICQSSDIKILYSPLHGCGYKVVPEMLKKFGFRNITILDSQSKPDGEFPNAPYPNPEEKDAMKLGIEQAEKTRQDIFIATDPDADRIGVGYRSSTGTYELLNGNQIGTLITEYLLTMPHKENSFIISTIVSSPLIKVIAEAFNVKYYESLTGFRWIAEEIDKHRSEHSNFLFAFEESHGYSISDKIMDKDGILATAIMAELTAFYKKQNKYLDEVLLDIARTYGYYKESQYSLSYPGAEGAQIIQKIMNSLRSAPPKSIADLKVLKIIDYKNDQTGLPKSDVFMIKLENNVQITARPSGTEPKVKFYFSTHGSASCSGCIAGIDKEHDIIKDKFLTFIKNI